MLSWPSWTHVRSWQIQRSENGGSFQSVTTLEAGATDYLDSTLVPAARYEFQLLATGRDGAGSALPCGAMIVTPPTAPSSVSAEALPTGAVSLAWAASQGATAYTLYRASSAAGPFVPLDSTADTNDTDPLPGTPGFPYDYQVVAWDDGGPSDPSAVVEAQLFPPPSVAGLTGMTIGTDRVGLLWGASNGATAYWVMRSTVPGGPYRPVTLVATTSFIDSGLSPGTSYEYVVEAVNAAGAGGSAAEISVTTIPFPPSGLTAIGGPDLVTLSWTASNGATDYGVFRGLASGGPYVQAGLTAGANFLDAGLLPGVTYFYVIEAMDGGGVSVWSQEAWATTAPTAPVGLTATAVAETITVAWSSAAAATAYVVSRSTASGGPYAVRATVAATRFDDTGLTPGMTYFYVVQSEGPTGMSADSAEVGATTAPPAPTGLSAAGGAGQVSLTWAAALGATGYSILSATKSGGPYAPSGATTALSFIVSGLGAGATCYFVVQATNPAGMSGDSLEVAATTAPPAPTNLTAVGGRDEIVLSWLASAAATAYVVFRGTASGGPYAQAAATTATTFADTGLAAGPTYYYVIEAENTGGASGTSNEAGAVALSEEFCILNNGIYTVEAFDAVQNGDGPPLRSFGSATHLARPYGVAVDTVNNELWVANVNTNSVTVYSRTASGNLAPVRILSGGATGLATPIGIAVDTVNNELFVANFQGNSITVYPRTASGNVAPLRTIAGGSTGLSNPWGVAVDTTDDEIAVSSYSNNEILVFGRTNNGNVAPYRTISGSSTGLSSPEGLGLDVPNNEVFVADAATGYIAIFQYNFCGLTRNCGGSYTGPPQRVIQGWLNRPQGLFVDTLNSEIQVADSYFGSGGVQVYAEGAAQSASPLTSISGASTGLSTPEGIAVDAVNNETFVADSGSNTITVYPRTANGNVVPLRALSAASTGMANPFGIAIDLANGEILVVDNASSSISAYPRTATGNVSPLRTIAGASTQLLYPHGITLDTTNNEIWASNDTWTTTSWWSSTTTPYAVTVYPRTVSNNAPPSRTISGSGTTLSSPYGVAVDPVHDWIYVANNGNSTVTVYPRASNGNVTPSRTISGASLSQPWGAGLDLSNSELLVANNGNNSISAYPTTANGNVSPAWTLSGGLTQLSNPVGVVVDPVNNEMSVANEGNNTITVYPRRASGNTAPLRTLSGASTGLVGPIGLGICK